MNLSDIRKIAEAEGMCRLNQREGLFYFVGREGSEE